MTSIPFKFGIQVLDEKLIRRDSDPARQPSLWSAAIVGPDGTGKSILAMHIAAEYLHQHMSKTKPGEQYPHVFYVSTDLSATVAKSTLHHFGLYYPNLRSYVLNEAYENFASPESIRDYLKTSNKLASPEIRVVEIRPSHAEAKSVLLTIKEAGVVAPTIYFVDLQADSAGDDWYFVNQLLGLFQGTTKLPSLVIVDAVEGLEAFVGDLDTFGEVRLRRSRIAQLSRMCVKSKTNAVFVVERDDDNHREPEQFIVDYVVTLRNRTEQEFVKRTIEIEKFRGCWHARGEHELTIRQGRGAFTGDEANLDDPPIPWTVKRPVKKLYNNYLAHMLVVPSLHFVNREFRENRRPLNDPEGRPKFGLKLLDDLLGNSTSDISQEVSTTKGSITLLLGDAGTHKGRLARQFLSHGLLDNINGVAILISTGLIDKAGLISRLSAHIPESSLLPDLMHPDSFKKLRRKHAAVIRAAVPRILCRRLSVRHLTSAHLLHIIDTQIRWAKAVTKGREVSNDGFGHIQLVIDDWNSIIETHPNIADDPLFLQTLIANLKREGVAALIVSTQPGQPFVETQDLSRFDLRKIDEQHIYTWSTSFFGERRTAITCLNDRRGPQQPTVLELRPLEIDRSTRETEAISVGREFALYQGIENGNAIRVPLEIRLLSIGDPQAAPLVRRYAEMINETFNRVFANNDQVQVVHFDSFTDYDRTATFSEWMDDTRLGRTLVMQIDEFWKLGNGKSHRQSLMDLSNYWNDEVVGQLSVDRKRIQAVRSQSDVYGVWQTMEKPEYVGEDSITARYWKKALSESPQKNQSSKGVLHRADMVDDEIRICEPTDRIPYLWDFGFILADKTLWKTHADEPVEDSCNKTYKVRDIWNALCVKGDWLDSYTPPPDDVPNITWHDFFSATRRIASLSDANAMDTDLLTIETICSLLLEIWASVAIQNGNGKHFEELSKRCPEEKVSSSRVSMSDLLGNNRDELKIAIMTLLHAFPQLSSSQDRSIHHKVAKKRFVASREWYSTAVHRLQVDAAECGKYSYLALPGSFCTRGDWFLAVAAGSRSQLLAERSIDLLTSRRMGLMRLHAGLGLPVRDILRGRMVDSLGTALPRYDHIERDSTGKIKADGNSKSLSYGDLKSLGAKQNVRKWLWRSRIKDYDRDTFYFQRWIARVLFERDIWFREAAHRSFMYLFGDKLTKPLYQTELRTSGQSFLDFSATHLEHTITLLESALRSNS